MDIAKVLSQLVEDKATKMALIGKVKEILESNEPLGVKMEREKKLRESTRLHYSTSQARNVLSSMKDNPQAKHYNDQIKKLERFYAGTYTVPKIRVSDP